jgi:hypothetical protein
MLKVLSIAIVLVATSAQAELQSPDYCQQKHGSAVSLPTSTDITFSGNPLIYADWVEPHDTIIIEIDDITLRYTRDDVDHIGVLMDWIGTALHQEAEHGYATLAVLDREKEIVWLISQSVYDNELYCFGHPLSLPVDARL